MAFIRAILITVAASFCLCTANAQWTWSPSTSDQTYLYYLQIKELSDAWTERYMVGLSTNAAPAYAVGSPEEFPYYEFIYGVQTDATAVVTNFLVPQDPTTYDLGGGGGCSTDATFTAATWESAACGGGNWANDISVGDTFLYWEMIAQYYKGINKLVHTYGDGSAGSTGYSRTITNFTVGTTTNDSSTDLDHLQITDDLGLGPDDDCSDVPYIISNSPPSLTTNDLSSADSTTPVTCSVSSNVVTDSSSSDGGRDDGSCFYQYQFTLHDATNYFYTYEGHTNDTSLTNTFNRDVEYSEFWEYWNKTVNSAGYTNVVQNQIFTKSFPLVTEDATIYVYETNSVSVSGSRYVTNSAVTYNAEDCNEGDSVDIGTCAYSGGINGSFTNIVVTAAPNNRVVDTWQGTTYPAAGTETCWVYSGESTNKTAATSVTWSAPIFKDLDLWGAYSNSWDNTTNTFADSDSISQGGVCYDTDGCYVLDSEKGIEFSQESSQEGTYWETESSGWSKTATPQKYVADWQFEFRDDTQW